MLMDRSVLGEEPMMVIEISIASSIFNKRKQERGTSEKGMELLHLQLVIGKCS
jgi:hypothetical protein